MPKISPKLKRGHPSGGAECRWGRLNAGVVAENWRLLMGSVVSLAQSQVCHTECPCSLIVSLCYYWAVVWMESALLDTGSRELAMWQSSIRSQLVGQEKMRSIVIFREQPIQVKWPMFRYSGEKIPMSDSDVSLFGRAKLCRRCGRWSTTANDR